MTEAAVDHRRAVADRNGAAILSATNHLLTERKPLTMAAIAAEAGVSRPTLYAHYSTIGEVVDAVVKQAVDDAVVVIEAANLSEGSPPDALRRLIASAWEHLAGLDALTAAAAEHLSATRLHDAHTSFVKRIAGLVVRGQEDGSFRDDMSVEWLVRMYVATMHAADSYASSPGVDRDQLLETLATTVLDIFQAHK